MHVKHGDLRYFPGGYQYYIDKTSAETQASAVDKTAEGSDSSAANSRGGSRSGGKSREQKRLEAEQRQERSRARRQHEKLVVDLESQIATWEARQLALTEALERPETYEAPGEAIKINRDLIEAVDALERLNREWEQAAAKLNEFSAA